MRSWVVFVSRVVCCTTAVLRTATAVYRVDRFVVVHGFVASSTPHDTGPTHGIVLATSTGKL